MTDRLTVHRLVNINPGLPRSSSTAALRKPQHHRLRSPRSESKSFSFLKQVDGVKRSIAGEGGGAPPPPEEVKRLKPPRCKVPLPMRAPSVNVEDACFSVKMLYQAWQSLKKMVVHLWVQRPPKPLQTTVMDYVFKVNVLAGHLEREVAPPQRR
jgi:hypothetical protein